MIQKYCRNWEECESNPIVQGQTWPVVEIFNPRTAQNDEIYVDEVEGYVYLRSEGKFYKSYVDDFKG